MTTIRSRLDSLERALGPSECACRRLPVHYVATLADGTVLPPEVCGLPPHVEVDDEIHVEVDGAGCCRRCGRSLNEIHVARVLDPSPMEVQ